MNRATPCQCEQCADDPSPTWTRAYAIECEARWLLSLPLAFRRQYLAKPAVSARAEMLKAEMLRLHAQARGGG